MRTVVLFASLVVLVYSTSLVSSKYLRVLNGTDDKKNEFPYVVSLESFISLLPDLEIYSVCTGSLIAVNWVLTAGHCMLSVVELVRYGDMSVPRNTTRSISLVLKKLRHPNYMIPFLLPGGSLVQNDIGLIFIEKIDMSVGKISAVDCNSIIGHVVRFAGFGAKHAKQNMKDNRKSLQLGKGLVISCPRLANFMWFPSLCIIPKCSNIQQDTAQGDSGGPLTLDGKIVGVISGGVEDPKASMFTPVSPYLEWIGQQMLRFT